MIRGTIPRDKLPELRQRLPEYWQPLLTAVEQGVGLLTVLQENSRFDVPPDEQEIPWLNFLQAAQPGIPTLLCTVEGGTA